MRNKPPITDIAVLYDNEKCPPGYTKIEQNINRSVSGCSVYLCFTREGAEYFNAHR